MRSQAHIFFIGRVQGVGFRFLTRTIALRHGVFGWVRNVFDGRVEVLAQGNEDDLGSFLNDLREEFSGYITDEDVEWQKVKESMDDFSIKLY